jgi:hypothetical protein
MRKIAAVIYSALVEHILAGLSQPLDPGRPFRLRRGDVAQETMKMLDQRLLYLPQARIGKVVPALKHHIGEAVFGHIARGNLLESVICCIILGLNGHITLQPALPESLDPDRTLASPFVQPGTI